MADWIVPLSDVRFTDAEVEAVAATYRSGWLSQGPKVAQFEAEFARYVRSRHAVAVASATAALHLICVAVGLDSGDEVVLPSLTFAATAAAAVQAGATPVFADIRDVRRPWLSSDSVEAAISPRTRAIINVAYAGHPGEVLELRELANSRGLVLIEDAAHALGSTIAEQSAGTIGDAGAFSFFANKNMPLGEGGMLVTDDDAVAQRARLLRSHGLTADTWARHRGGEVEYDVVEPGFNYRLDEPRAALGLLLLGRITEDNRSRAALADAYSMSIESLDGVSAAIAPTTSITNAWHLYPVLLDEGVDRGAFRARLRGAGVQTSVHYPPLHLTRAFAGYGDRPLPSTEDYARRSVTMPLFPHMTEQQQAHVLATIAAALTA